MGAYLLEDIEEEITDDLEILKNLKKRIARSTRPRKGSNSYRTRY